MTRATPGFGRRIDTACSALLGGVALGCAVLAAFVALHPDRYLTGAKQAAVFLAAPLVLGVAALFATRLAVVSKLRLLVLLVSTSISLLATELYLVGLESYRAAIEAREFAAAVEDDKRAWKDYDDRSTRQFFADHWAQGTRVLPRIYQLSSRAVDVDGVRVFPTSNVSGRLVVECFADGRYKVYLSDEYGFANPHGLLSRPVDVVLVGDSFTAGECVSTEQDIAAVLRQSHPSTVNLGIGGAGPLWELANLVEYGLPLRPKTVFWLYYEGNDLADLGWEAGFPELNRYLASDEARLRPRKAAVDARVAELQTREIESLREIRGDCAHEQRALPRLLRALRLSSLRGKLALSRDDSREARARIATLAQVVARAKSLVEKQGGRFILVYVPDYSRFAGGSVDFDRELVLAAFAEQRVTVLDLLPVLAQHPDVLSLYPHRRMGHFNAAGYAFIAQRLRAELAPD